VLYAKPHKRSEKFSPMKQSFAKHTKFSN
jgi:hypothetical protein